MEDIYILFVFLDFHESTSQADRRACRKIITQIATSKMHNDIYTLHCSKEDVEKKQKEILKIIPIKTNLIFNVVLEKTWIENQRKITIGLRGNAIEIPNDDLNF